MSELSYYCFSTPQNNYIYVRNINSIVRVKEEEYQELLRVKKTGDIDSPVVEKYRDVYKRQAPTLTCLQMSMNWSQEQLSGTSVIPFARCV